MLRASLFAFWLTASAASLNQGSVPGGERLVVALTFDDLPSHGDLPPGVSRLAVSQTILGTLQEQKLPPVYGFV